MNRRSTLAITAALLATTMSLAGCGERGAKTDTGTGGGAKGKKVLTIGVIAPLSGDLSALGKGIQNSVDLAVKQANASGSLGDIELKVSAQDDEAKPEKGQNAATKLSSDETVIGVVGPLNSSVGQSVQPVLNTAKITLVSPANTNPALTKGANFATAPKRTYDTYFRTCTTDDIQGPFAAKYLIDNNIKKVATIHDKKAYGQGLVDAFTKKFKELGGEVVAAETLNPADSNFNTVITSVKGKSPQAVYYGGEYPQAGPLSSQMKTAGLNVPLMGGDGIYSPKFVDLAGKTSTGDLSTSVGAPTEKLASAKKFVADYEKGGYSDPYEAYGAYSFDAANAIIEALKASGAKDAKAARSGVLSKMPSVSFDGVTGKVAFDEYGDSKSRVLTVYKVTNSKWVDVNTSEFK